MAFVLLSVVVAKFHKHNERCNFIAKKKLDILVTLLGEKE